MTTAALIAAAAVTAGAPAHVTVQPQFGVLDGQVRIAVHTHGTIVDARFVGGVASKGKWLNWVRLRSAGTPDGWWTILRAPGYYGTYPVQLKVDGKVIDTDATVGILPKHFETIPAYWSPTDVAGWWASTNHVSLLGVSTWESGYFTHRDVRLNRLLKVRSKSGSRVTTLYLSIARLAANRPWRLVEIAPAP